MNCLSATCLRDAPATALSGPSGDQFTTASPDQSRPLILVCPKPGNANLRERLLPAVSSTLAVRSGLTSCRTAAVSESTLTRKIP